MKRLFILLLGLALGCGIGWLGWNVWETTRYFQAHGRDAKLTVGERYNATRWARPVPVKKIFTYTAKLEPKYDVLIESDQELKPGQVLSIRFLTRDVAGELLAFSKRPVANSIRLRGADDGNPVKIEETDAFDRLVDKAMGPPAAGVYQRARTGPESAPSTAKPTVPFLIQEPGDSTWDLVWRNSRAGEWLVLAFAALGVFSLLSAALERQKLESRPDSDDKHFIHPSLRKVDAAAADAPSRKLSYVPRPDEEIVLPESRKPPVPAANPAATPPPLPAASATPVANPVATQPPLIPAAIPIPVRPAPPSAATPADTTPPIREIPSLSDGETAPPMPINREEPVLRLRRKTPGGEDPSGNAG